MPENKILSLEEALELGQNNPLLVIEGYINDPEILIAQINAIGIKAIVNANSATVPQYADSTAEVIDKQAMEDIAFYADLEKKRDIKNTALNIDHMYCASLAEEIGEAK